eukprot:TRINITY_DN74825_c0_g1_i1.p1 TRINITY_DN74825_c0_g1~~TRINITY_DN74825_c0_g1_i1.p1  ORF type:complete len:408 (+),score=56.40 TRINITY_DN74825_c0_g1_i1:51-1226(+)
MASLGRLLLLGGQRTRPSLRCRQSFLAIADRRWIAADAAEGGSQSQQPPSPMALSRALHELGAGEHLSRKPWLVLERHRRALEQHFDLDTASVLLGLQGWAQVAAGGLPTVTGIGNVSGNVYFACDLIVRLPGSDAPVLHISAVRALIANLFSHGEIGLDAIVSADDKPNKQDLSLIRELYTSPEVRWLHSNLTLDELERLGRETLSDEPERQKPKEVVLTTSGRWEVKKRRSLGKYPTALNLIGESGKSDIRGDCLRHDGFLHHEVEGSTMDEWQLSLAQGAAKKAYTAGGEAPAAGCAVRSVSGKLYAGSTIGARGEDAATVTPLECALVSMAANGSHASQMDGDVVWIRDNNRTTDCTRLRAMEERDSQLLHSLSPGAKLQAMPIGQE